MDASRQSHGGSRLSRRELVTLATGALALVPLAAHAEEADHSGSRPEMPGTQPTDLPACGPVASDASVLDDPLARPFALNPTTLWGGEAARMAETNLGDLAGEALYNAAADALAQEEPGPDPGSGDLPVVALLRGSAIGTSLPRAILTWGDVARAFRDAGDAKLAQVNLADVETLLLASLGSSGALADEQVTESDEKSLVPADGEASPAVSQAERDFIQVAGLTIICGAGGDAGQGRISLEPLGSRGSDATGLAWVIADELTMGRLAPRGSARTVGAVVDIVATYLNDLVEGFGMGCLPYLSGSRGHWVFPGSPLSEGFWDAAVLVVDGADAPLTHACMVLEIDSAWWYVAASEEDGVMHLRLPAGPHAISLVGRADEVDLGKAPALAGIAADGVVSRTELAFVAANSVRPTSEVLVDPVSGVGLHGGELPLMRVF